MGKKEKRQQALVALLNKHKTVDVKHIANELHVSEMTIRRDLDFLENQGSVLRGHGTARLNPIGNFGLVNEPYQNIENIYNIYSENEKQSKEKESIAKYAASIINSDDVLIIDNGSTMYTLANYIPDDKNITVACYNMSIAAKLWNKKNIEFLLAGGKMQTRDFMFVSNEGVNFLSNIRADKLFLAASGVHETLGLTCANNYEVAAKQAVLNSALEVILVADSSKFGVVRTIFFSQLTEVDLIITDKGITENWIEIIKNAGIGLVIV